MAEDGSANRRHADTSESRLLTGSPDPERSNKRTDGPSRPRKVFAPLRSGRSTSPRSGLWVHLAGGVRHRTEHPLLGPPRVYRSRTERRWAPGSSTFSTTWNVQRDRVEASTFWRARNLTAASAEVTISRRLITSCASEASSAAPRRPTTRNNFQRFFYSQPGGPARPGESAECEPLRCLDRCLAPPRTHGRASRRRGAARGSCWSPSRRCAGCR